MTRINAGIPPAKLCDQHLLAEHREIKRLPRSFTKRIESKKGFDDIPNEFKLGKGHVLFFVTRGKYTLQRYIQIHRECLRRGFNVQNYESNWHDAYKEYSQYFNDWCPRKKDIDIVKARIKERMPKNPRFKSNF